MTLLTSARSELGAHGSDADARRYQHLGAPEGDLRSNVDASRISVGEFLDICATRGLLEEQAARLAARNITSKDVDALEKIVASLESAVVARRAKDVATLQRRFHFTIYRAAKRSHLLKLVEELWDLSARYTQPSASRTSAEWADELHVVRSIVSACKLKDENALGLMLRYKVRRDSARLLESAERGASENRAVASLKATRADVRGRPSRRS